MKPTNEYHRSTLEDFAKEYVENRVEMLVKAGNWDSDRYPDISRLNERLSSLEEKLCKQIKKKCDVQSYSVAAFMYAKALAREAYLLGILDGGHIQQKFSAHEIP